MTYHRHMIHYYSQHVFHITKLTVTVVDFPSIYNIYKYDFLHNFAINTQHYFRGYNYLSSKHFFAYILSLASNYWVELDQITGSSINHTN